MKIRLLAAAVTLLMSGTTLAASDGNPGATSTGTSVISVTLPKLIRARSFADFNLGTYTGTGDLNGNDDLNISTNYDGAGRTYEVEITGDGAGGAFTITDGTQTIAYNVYYNDATGTVGRAAATSGTPLTAQGGASKPLADATLNANLSVEIVQANLQAVDAGLYTGTVTLVYTPE